MITVRCPHCQTPRNVSDSLKGRTITCAKCNATISVSDSSGPAKPVAPKPLPPNPESIKPAPPIVIQPVRTPPRINEQPQSPRPNRAQAGDGKQNGGTKTKLSKKSIIIIASAASVMLLFCCGGMGFMAFFGSKQEKAVREELSAADVVWDTGDKAGGAAKYQKIVDDGNVHWLKEPDRARLYGRLIDYRYEKNDASAGEKLLDRASKEGITPAVNHAEAKSARAVLESKKKTKETTAAKKKSRYSRDEFKDLVLGKSKSELLEALGKPRSTQEIGEFAEYWYYHGITFDPITDKTDSIAQLTFMDGRVSSVLFT